MSQIIIGAKCPNPHTPTATAPQPPHPVATPLPSPHINCFCGQCIPNGTGDSICPRCGYNVASQWRAYYERVSADDDPLGLLEDPFVNDLTPTEKVVLVGEVAMRDTRYAPVPVAASPYDAVRMFMQSRWAA